MGILLEILGLLVAFMIAAKALKQAGIDIGWLNPFTFFHRRAWRNNSRAKARLNPSYTTVFCQTPARPSVLEDAVVSPYFCGD
jgi:hypothetical protein